MLSVEEVNIPRVMLHAKTLGFIHPDNEKAMEFTAPFPFDMRDVVEALRDSTTVLNDETVHDS